MNSIKKNNTSIDIDPKVKSSYDMIMKNYSNITSLNLKWEKIGENYKQFSLYETHYKTKTTNSIVI